MKRVTQERSKTTGVTCDAYVGEITTVALTDAADTGFSFTVTNKKARPGCQIMLSPIYAGTTGDIALQLVSQTKGSFVVKVKNVGTAVLNAVAKINFRINYD